MKNYLIKHLLLALKNIKEQLLHHVTDTEIELIKNSHLFDKLDKQTFGKLLKSIKVVHYLADDSVLKEGDLAHELYIIADGSVRVFTISHDNKKIALTRLNKGDYFGEQALLGELTKTRSASIEAITDTTLLTIDQEFILKTFKIDKVLEDRLKKVGHQQVMEKLSATLDFYQNIKAQFKHDQEQDVIELNQNHILFKAGDLSDCVYIIVRGSVSVILPQDQNVTITLKKGHLFGELGVLNNTTRAATVITLEPTRLMRISAKRFKELYTTFPNLQNIFKTLQKIYFLDRGLVEQSFGKIMGMDSITTIFKLNDGRTVIASHLLDNPFFMIKEEAVKESQQLFIYEKEAGKKIELSVANNYIVSIKCDGISDDLSMLCAALLEHQKIPNNTLESFKSTGEFKLDISQVDLVPDIVCNCMSVKKDTIQKLIEEGVKSLALISNKTGACTVCGTCRPRILCMLGQSTWLPAIMTVAIKHNDYAASYDIRPSTGQFNSFVPGEHIVIQIRIGTNWVERAYTLSDLSENGTLRITIKKEEAGLFSEWLFNNPLTQFPIYCSQPQGNFTINLDSSKPVLCFAGGIGITPFITFAKMLHKQQTQRPMHLVYIAPTKNDFLFLEEFTDITNKTSSISITFWEKRISGVFPEEKIAEAVKILKDGDIYICGPEGFELSIVGSLKKVNCNPEKIHIEKFTYANPINTKEE